MLTEMAPVEVRSHAQQTAVGAQRYEVELDSRISLSAAPRGCAATRVQRGAIGVPEHQARCCVIAIEQHRELIESDATVAITHSPSDGTGHWIDGVSCVHDHEVIAIGVHLVKTQRHEQILATGHRGN